MLCIYLEGKKGVNGEALEDSKDVITKKNWGYLLYLIINMFTTY